MGHDRIARRVRCTVNNMPKNRVITVAIGVDNIVLLCASFFIFFSSDDVRPEEAGETRPTGVLRPSKPEFPPPLSHGLFVTRPPRRLSHYTYIVIVTGWYYVILLFLSSGGEDPNVYLPRARSVPTDNARIVRPLPRNVVWQTKPVTSSVQRWISSRNTFFFLFFYHRLYSGIVCPHSVRQRLVNK